MVKRIVSCTFVILLVLGMTGCSSTNNGETSEKSKEKKFQRIIQK